MDYKYLPTTKTRVCRPKGGNYLISNDDYVRNRYYAFIKHRSFRVARKEAYTLTWSEWDAVWTQDLWERRGRGVDNVQMYRIDPALPWAKDNIEILSRRVRGCKVKYDQ